MNHPIIHRQRLAGLLAALLSCTAAHAERHGHDDAGEHDHERARHALARGEVLPIAEILARVAAAIPGEVVEVEFERAGPHGADAWRYELKIITPEGRLREVQVDAATGRILETEDD